MFDDPNKELEALQAQIDAQEEWFRRELDSAKRMIGDAPRAPKPTSPMAGVSANRSAQTVRMNPVQEKPAVKEVPKKKSNRGLAILALVELLGILGLAGYWLLFLL